MKYILYSNKYEIIFVSKSEKNIQKVKEIIKDDRVLFFQNDITDEVECQILLNESLINF